MVAAGLTLAGCVAANSAPLAAESPTPAATADSRTASGLLALRALAPPSEIPGDLLDVAARAEFESTFGRGASVVVVPLNNSAPSGVIGPGVPYAWSTSKVLVVVTALARLGGVDGLSDEQREWVTGALTASDNESAALLMSAIEEQAGGFDEGIEALTQTLRTVGDTGTQAQATDEYSTGETVWALPEQAQFVAAVRRGCVLDQPAAEYLFTEMAGVIDEQRWGLGSVGAVAFKGGWDVDDDDLAYVRQVGVVKAPNGNEYIVAIATRVPLAEVAEGDDETDPFVPAYDELTRIAAWVTGKVTAAPAPAAC